MVKRFIEQIAFVYRTKNQKRVRLGAVLLLTALPMIVLMTDGIANRPSGTSTARAYALSEAQLAADSG